MTASSRVVERCQVCDSPDLESVLFVGYLPPVNQLWPIGRRPAEQPSYPAELLLCSRCHLAQLGLVVDPKILFPATYPYTSSTTKILRENFADLAREVAGLMELGRQDLVVDIGSNDGNLLSNFVGKHEVLGVTPEDIGRLAVERGIPTLFRYFDRETVREIAASRGQAKLVTATNVFAHIDNVNDLVKNVLDLLAPQGVFVSESHYLGALMETVQYDTIYHEHLRYYSVHSLKTLLEAHGLEIFHVQAIPTHGGSIRVYAGRRHQYPVRESVSQILTREQHTVLSREALHTFARRVVQSKLALHALLLDIKGRGARIYGIGAPSRASTLINYVGLDGGIMDTVLEVPGSHKIGHYIPGTIVPIEDQRRLLEDQPEYALLLSWHIGEELAHNIKQRGYRGDFITPLPKPRLVRNNEVG
jgi:hypothetical protein